MLFIRKYLEIIEQKAIHWDNVWPEGNNPEMYLHWLKDEVSEVFEEIKDNNHVYLEDELWDILWDYLNVLHYLEREGKIRSAEHVFHRSFQKFSERVEWQLTWVLRDEVKKKQKTTLADEHRLAYES